MAKIRCRKYRNRKIYHLPQKRYINMKELYTSYLAGQEFLITDSTDRDITDSVLAQAIFNEHRDDHRFLKMVVNYAK